MLVLRINCGNHGLPLQHRSFGAHLLAFNSVIQYTGVYS